jgi:hypothetical protein
MRLRRDHAKNRRAIRVLFEKLYTTIGHIKHDYEKAAKVSDSYSQHQLSSELEMIGYEAETLTDVAQRTFREYGMKTDYRG